MKKVAVIGGGFSGLTTAYYLQKKGYHVTIFEKDLRIGGQCFTIHKGRQMCELGCVFGASHQLLNLLKELGVKNEYRYFYRSFLTMIGKKMPQIENSKIARFQEQYKRLPTVLKQYESILKVPGFTNIPTELTVSFEEWCKENDLDELSAIYAPHFAAFGYGNLKDTSAIYVLKHLDLETLSWLVEGRSLIYFPKGVSEITQKLASLIEDIRYGAEVLQVMGGERVSIRTNIGTYYYDQVIITTPMDQEGIKQKDFARLMGVYQQKYYNVLAYCIEGTYRTTTYFKENFLEEGRLLLLHGYNSESDNKLITTYCYGDINIEQLKSNIDSDLIKAGVEVRNLFAYKRWKTFPHVKQVDLASGFYDKLARIQGRDGIYFAGGLTCFPNMGKLCEFAKFFVDEYFDVL